MVKQQAELKLKSSQNSRSAVQTAPDSLGRDLASGGTRESFGLRSRLAGSYGALPQLHIGSPYGLGKLVHPLANIRVLDFVVRAHELQRLSLDHEIGLVPRQFLGLVPKM